MIGQTVSHYRVVEKLGGGGMGVVYRAEDTRLRRNVAVKVLPPELTRDEEAKQRFVVEAQAASALDHPNICTIHEIDETAEGQLFLVMAFYDGETIKKKIERGPLKLDEALDLAIQIAQGLVKAHAAGIAHRDIKPANVLVTSDGLAKIVDFGLAKLLGETGITRQGTTLGTVAYMSPEQTLGEKVDARSDVWSLGVVLYEMIAGQLPFRGEQKTGVANAIVNNVPAPLTSLRTGVPLELERVVNRALAKQPGDRYQTAADLLSELRRIKRESDEHPTLTRAAFQPAARRNASRAVAIGAGALLVAGAIAYLASRRETRSALPQLTNPVQVAASVGVEGSPSWSPDGRMLVYQSDQSGNQDIWVTQVDGGPPVNRTADHVGFDGHPRWSPDGRQIAFISAREGGGVFVMPALGGGARRIASTYPASHPPVWSPDGSELAYLVALPDFRLGLERRHLRDGTTKQVDLPGRKGNQRLDFAWSPDGRFLAYVDARNYTAQVTQLWLLRLSDGHATSLSDGRRNEWRPSWSPDSRALYFVSNRGGTMDVWLQRVSEDGTAATPERLTTGLEVQAATLSADGRRIAYVKGRVVGNVWRAPILADRPATWADAQQLTFDQAHVEFLDVTRDGLRLAIGSDRSGNPDLWILPAGGGEMQQLTSDPTPDWDPAWSPDGREMAFYAYRSGNREIWVQPVAGGPARQLTRGEAESVFPRWSPDGKMIAYASRIGGSGDIWVLPAAGGEARQVVGDPSGDFAPDWSPDGEWLAFQSNRSGQNRIWRVPSAGGQPEPLTKGAGTFPRWSIDGKWVFFRSVREDPGQLWGASLDGKTERPFSKLSGKRGFIDVNALATDGKQLYFTWREDLADIWVMDVVHRQRD